MDPKFSSLPIFSARELELSYNLPVVFLGRISLGDIAIRSGRVRLEKVDSIWNFESLLPKSEPNTTDRDRTDPEKSEGDPLVQLPIPISIYTKLELSDFEFYLDDKESEEPVQFQLTGLDFLFELDTDRFRRIESALDSITIIDKIHLALNPERPVGIQFQNPRVQTNLALNSRLKLLSEGSGKDWKIQTDMNLGGTNLTYRVPGQAPKSLDFAFQYNFLYDPGKDQINLEFLRLVFQNAQWLSISGILTKPLNEDRVLDFALEESRIHLSDLNPILQDFLTPAIRLTGLIQLDPLRVKGPVKDLDLDWKFKSKDLSFQKAKTSLRSKYLEFSTFGKFNLEPGLNPSPEWPVPQIQVLKINDLRVEFNGLTADGQMNLEPGNILLKLNLNSLNLHDFIGDLFGYLDAKLVVFGKDFSGIQSNLEAYLKNFRFTIQNSRSGPGFISLRAKTDLNLKENFTPVSVNLSELSLGVKNAKITPALNLVGAISLDMDSDLVANISKLNLNLNFPALMPILPLVLREKMASLEGIFGTKTELGLRGTWEQGPGLAKLDLNGKIPGIEINDLKGKIRLGIPKPGNQIYLDEFNLSAFGNKLNVSASGKLFEKPGVANPPLGPYFGDIKTQIKLNSKKEEYLAKGLSFRGDLFFDANIKDYDVKGELVSNDSRFFINSGKCPSETCKLYLIDSLNAEIPIHHDLRIQETKPLIEGDKARFIKTYGRLPKPNFSIREVIGSHPSIPGAPFAYMKSIGSYPGFTARIQYLENYLWIDGLKFSLLDGVVYGKDILMNVGSGDPRSMEFMGSLQVRDIDLRQLLSLSVQKKIDDGKIKADLNLSGRDLSNPIGNLSVYFSVFQIGRDFGKSALNVISTKGALMNFIADSYAVDKVEIELSRGLVYADVLFKKSPLTYIINLENSKISQQRMPLANFLQRAENEISTYR